MKGLWKTLHLCCSGPAFPIWAVFVLLVVSLLIWFLVRRVWSHLGWSYRLKTVFCYCSSWFVKSASLNLGVTEAHFPPACGYSQVTLIQSEFSVSVFTELNSKGEKLKDYKNFLIRSDPGSVCLRNSIPESAFLSYVRPLVWVSLSKIHSMIINI